MSTASSAALPGVSMLSPAARRARADRWFFSSTAVAQIALIVWGFAPTYYLKAAYGTAPLSALLHVHGALFTTWLVLLITQTTLVATRRTPVHRRLGIGGMALAAAMLIVGYLAGIDAAHRGATLPGMTPEAFLMIPLGAIAVFAVLVAAAFLLRRRPDYHKRLMMLATAELMSAGVARIPMVVPLGPVGFFGIPDLFLLALCAFDVVMLRRIHLATLAGGAFLVASQGVRLFAAGTNTWMAVATWLMS